MSETPEGRPWPPGSSDDSCLSVCLAQLRFLRRRIVKGRRGRRSLVRLLVVVLDLVVAVLAIKAAHGRVVVKRPFLDLVESVEIARPGIDALDAGAGVVDPLQMARQQPAPGIHDRIDTITRGVARVRGAEDRQHEIGTLADSPDGERLAEIFVVMLDAPPGGRDVEDA